jgi:hypothetical protein
MSDVKEVRYPHNRVVATLEATALDASLTALTSTGIPRDSIFVLTPDDIGHVDSPLTETGVSGFMHRLILSFGVDRDVFDQLREEVVARGRVIVTVPVEGDDEKAQAAAILRNHGAHTLRYVGRWATEDL